MATNSRRRAGLWQLQSLLVVCDSSRTCELHSHGFQVSWISGYGLGPRGAGWNVTGQRFWSDLSLLKGNPVHYEPSEMIKYMLLLSCLLNLPDMRSDQRALWLEVKKQIIKYLDSDFLFLSWFGLKWSVLNKFWAAKDQNQLKLWNNVHYVSIFYFTYKKTLSQLPQIKIFSWCDFFLFC